MDPLSAVVALVVALLAGGGIVGLLTARSSSRKLAAEADKTVVDAIGTGWGGVVDRLEMALARCETHSAELDTALRAALDGIHELREAALEAREVALALKERVSTIEREQPAQQRAAVKEAVGEVVRGLGALDPSQHEEGTP